MGEEGRPFPNRLWAEEKALLAKYDLLAVVYRLHINYKLLAPPSVRSVSAGGPCFPNLVRRVGKNMITQPGPHLLNVLPAGFEVNVFPLRP